MRFNQTFVSRQFGVLSAAVLFAAVVAPLSPPRLEAQLVVPGYQQAVGGISILSNGLIENAGVDKLAKFKAEVLRVVKNAPADINAPASLRKVSLRGLEAAIDQSLKTGKALPDEVLLLAGLQEYPLCLRLSRAERHRPRRIWRGLAGRRSGQYRRRHDPQTRPALGRPGHRPADRRIIGPHRHQLLDRSDRRGHPAISELCRQLADYEQ